LARVATIACTLPCRQAFAVFAVGFVTRPIGAAIFGHYVDRIGRKAALIATPVEGGLTIRDSSSRGSLPQPYYAAPQHGDQRWQRNLHRGRLGRRLPSR
jgi:hypothetical protein